MLGIFFDSAKTSNFLAESFNGSTCFGFVMISCDLVQAPADWEHFIEKMLYKNCSIGALSTRFNGHET